MFMAWVSHSLCLHPSSEPANEDHNTHPRIPICWAVGGSIATRLQRAQCRAGSWRRSSHRAAVAVVVSVMPAEGPSTGLPGADVGSAGAWRGARASSAIDLGTGRCAFVPWLLHIKQENPAHRPLGRVMQGPGQSLWASVDPSVDWGTNSQS